MSKAAGAPSEKSERPPSSPDVRPSELNRSLFSSFSCPVLPDRSSQRRECYSSKHEAQYAMNLFGAQPDIDFTIKRGHGAFSPLGGTREIVDVAGSRSANSDKCEAAQTLRFWGAAPYIEVVGRRGTGSCSPRMEGRDVEASCARRHHYLQDCIRSGLSDISEVYRLGAGECSPRCTLPTSPTPANLISKEVRLASGQKKLGRVTISPTVFEVEVPYITRDSSFSSSSRSFRRLLDDDESYDIPRWAHPTAASRARNAQDLSNVKALLHGSGSGSRTPRSCTTASVNSADDTSLCTHSCRLGTESSCASMKSGSGSVGTTSRCTHSCRLGSEASSLACSSSSTSRCTHSCRVGSRGSFSERSNLSSVSTTSSPYPASHKSFKLAGDILSELKISKTLTKSSRSPSSWSSYFDTPSSNMPGVFIPQQGPKLAGNILADLRTSPSRGKGFRCFDESPVKAKETDP